MTQSRLNQIRPITYTVNDKAQISIAKLKLEELAQKFGTPLYILCEETIRKRAQAYTQAFQKYYPNYQVIYASKALNCMALCKIMEQEGLGLDVVSAGELHTALRAKFPTEKIIFHGNNKSSQEIEMAIKNNVTIILDNYHDLKNIENYFKNLPYKLPDARHASSEDTELTDTSMSSPRNEHNNADGTCKVGSRVQIIIRITPGIECHTHDYIKTGSIDSKFGFNLEEVETVIERVLAISKNIHIRGLHAHIGSQIFETVPHKDTCKVLLTLYKKIKDKFDIEFPDLNVGGGLGIKYTETDDPPEIEEWVKIIAEAVQANCKELGLNPPRILTEPGRSLVGPAGVTIYRIGNIKDIIGIRKYLAIDGGMADNVRPIMYQARYTAELDGKVNATNVETVTIAGRYCESGDVLIKDIKLPKAQTGDLLAVYSTGAYNYSMASNYNRATKPTVVLVRDGQAHIIIEGESLDDLVKHDRLPEYLK